MSYVGGSHDVVYSPKFLYWFNVVEWIQITLAIMSCTGSGLVILTGFIFYREMVSRKIYMWMIMAMSISDFFASTGAAMGFPKPGPYCHAQAGLSIFFARASWMWCFAICATLYTQLTRRRIYLDIIGLNTVIWGLNLLLQFIPYAAPGKQQYGTSTTMRYAGRQKHMMCSLMSDIHPELWRVISIEVPLILILVAMFLLWVMLICRQYPAIPKPEDDPTGTKTELVKRARKVIKNILFYPVSMFLSWTPQAVVFFAYLGLGAHHTQDQDNNFFISSVAARAVGFSFGILLAVVFFWRSEESKIRWYDLLKSLATELGLWALIFDDDTPVKEDALVEEPEQPESELQPQPSMGRITPASSVFRPTRVSDIPIREGSKSTASRSTTTSVSKSSNWSSFSGSLSRSTFSRSTVVSGNSNKTSGSARSRRSSKRGSLATSKITSDFEEDLQTMSIIREVHSIKLGQGLTSVSEHQEHEAALEAPSGRQISAQSDGSSGLSTIMSASAGSLNVSLLPDQIPRSSSDLEAGQGQRSSATGTNPLFDRGGDDGVEMNEV